MPNYVLAQESNRANIPDALWYAMEETDLTDIANNESLSTGDKVYVIKANKTFIFGEDANWYPYANEGGGGGGGSEGVPDAPSEQGRYVLSVGASDNEWAADTKEHYEVRVYDKSKDQDWGGNENDQYVVETSQAELQEIVGKMNSGGATVSIYVHDGDGEASLYPMCSLIKEFPQSGLVTLAGMYFGIYMPVSNVLTLNPTAIGIVMLAQTCTVVQAMSISGAMITGAYEADSAMYASHAVRADEAGTADSLAYQMFGECSSGASSAAKTATIGGYSETTGITVFIAFANANTASNPTLNINNTSAYPIKVGSYTDPGTVGSFTTGVHAFTLVDDGNSKCWIINEGRDTVPEAPALEGAYYLRIHSGGVSWEGATKKGTVTLTPSAWTGSGPYTQTISSIVPVTVNTKIDLQPNVTTLTQMQSDGTTNIFVDNDNATLTAYALGAKPTASLTIQYTKTEVVS